VRKDVDSKVEHSDLVGKEEITVMLGLGVKDGEAVILRTGTAHSVHPSQIPLFDALKECRLELLIDEQRVLIQPDSLERVRERFLLEVSFRLSHLTYLEKEPSAKVPSGVDPLRLALLDLVLALQDRAIKRLHDAVLETADDLGPHSRVYRASRGKVDLHTAVMCKFCG
jgi:hypothetical protein